LTEIRSIVPACRFGITRGETPQASAREQKMPGIYVLIVLLAGGLGSAGSGGTSFSAEFNSLDACRAAETAVLAKIPPYRLSGDFVTLVQCFPKGAKVADSQP
jgi:hypothetical protein